MRRPDRARPLGTHLAARHPVGLALLGPALASAAIVLHGRTAVTPLQPDVAIGLLPLAALTAAGWPALLHHPRRWTLEPAGRRDRRVRLAAWTTVLALIAASVVVTVAATGEVDGAAQTGRNAVLFAGATALACRVLEADLALVAVVLAGTAIVVMGHGPDGVPHPWALPLAAPGSVPAAAVSLVVLMVGIAADVLDDASVENDGAPGAGIPRDRGRRSGDRRAGAPQDPPPPGAPRRQRTARLRRAGRRRCSA